MVELGSRDEEDEDTDPSNNISIGTVVEIGNNSADLREYKPLQNL